MHIKLNIAKKYNYTRIIMEALMLGRPGTNERSTGARQDIPSIPIGLHNCYLAYITYISWTFLGVDL